jgi:hypothetical protein
MESNYCLEVVVERKYEPLEKFLASQRHNEVPMTFAEVEQVLGRPLPHSAAKHRPWWANETRGHVHAKAWLGAGYETANVDMAAKKLVFRRIAKNSGGGMADEAREFKPSQREDEKKPRRHPLFGAMKGTFTLVPPDGTEPPPEDPESWEALCLAKFDRLLFGKGE